MKKAMKLLMWFACGFTAGLVAVTAAMASPTPREKITDDTVIYENLQEVNIAPEKELSFNHDIARLARLEPKYRENLPALSENPRLRAPVKRISQRSYQRPARAAPAQPVSYSR